MPNPRRKRKSVKILKAVSASIRMQILNLLYEKGPQSYTEIMNTLRLSPTRDAGKFAYHLKALLKVDLVEPDVKTKKYRLTDLGTMLIETADQIEQTISKRRKILVRTSRLAVEEFDKNKIAESLVKEANVPVDLAQKIARETEKRIQEFKTKYLTAPLIRELVNAILIEKGLEEYRHKLTRLGLPLYDVTQLIKQTGKNQQNVEAIHKQAANAVIEEYTLLTVLPRDIADDHLSGALHITNLGSWILKPETFNHDLRFFLKNGLNLGRTATTNLACPPPKTLEAALLATANLTKIATTETSGEQTLNYFNTFLAPLAQGLTKNEIKESLRSFIHTLNLAQTEVSLGIELLIPQFLEKQEAVGPEGKTVGTYADYTEETRLTASLLLEVLAESHAGKPVFNPSIIVKIRPETLKSQECEPLLIQCHELAAETGTPYFANLRSPRQAATVYNADGCRFPSDWTEDWELDTLRTGNIGNIILNLPRIMYDAEGNQTELQTLLNERLEKALRALEIKYRTIKQRATEGLLPFLFQKADGDRYFRIENSPRVVNLIGLNEATKSFTGQYINESEKALNFAEDLIKQISRYIQRRTKKPETRIYPALLPNAEAAKRLAELDVEKYGWSKVHAQGTRGHPSYTDMVAAPLESSIPWKERLNLEGKLHKLTLGGHLAIIQLADSEGDSETLLAATKHVLSASGIGLYAYSRNLAYCNSCQRRFRGVLPKCPMCGSVDTLVCFSRMSAKYLPVSQWVPAKRLVLAKRQVYTLTSD